MNALILALAGVGIEVAFVGLGNYNDPRLMGHSYLWMFPIYALIYPALKFLRPKMGHWHWAARAPLYVVFLYVVEYVAGGLIRAAVGVCPWDYGDAKWAVHGLIRLDYFPAWFGAVLLFERLYLHLEKIRR